MLQYDTYEYTLEMHQIFRGSKPMKERGTWATYRVFPEKKKPNRHAMDSGKRKRAGGRHESTTGAESSWIRE